MYLSIKDIMYLVGCSKSQANRLKKATNDYTAQRGVKLVGNNKCLAKDFGKLYGLTIDDIKKELLERRGKNEDHQD